MCLNPPDVVLANHRKKAKRPERRRLFGELMSGVTAMREHREGRRTLRTQRVEPITLRPVKPELVRKTREAQST
jgi:hypothetical protein